MYGGEEHLRDAIIRACRTLGINARVAIAPTFGAAWALARFAGSESLIADEREIGGAIGRLPVEALRLDKQTARDVRALGVERVEDLMVLPRFTLPARFGDDLLLRLDKAMGHAIETIRPVRPLEPPCTERVFDGPTTQWEAIEITLRALVESVCDQLKARESGARRIAVELERSDCSPTGFTLHLSSASRDQNHIWTLARPHLERAHLGFGVESIRVKATHLARLTHEQQERWRERAQAPGPGTTLAATQLTDTLVNRLGAHRIRVYEPSESHLPERAGRLRAARSIGRRLDPPARASADRPTLLFQAPEPIRVMALTPDGPVMRVTWRGENLKVITCVGPERLGPEWWAGDRSGRDYFKARDEHGRWLWIRRDLISNEWSIHGVWA